MIDTIVLTLTADTFRISDPDKFTPSARWATITPVISNRPLQSKQNPTKKELLLGAYKPRLTLSHRINYHGGRETTLKIEVSLPKLLFGNNFAELKYKDFTPIADKLVTILLSMGVIVIPHALAHAAVSMIHYSKNIELTDGSTPYYYINKIKETNVKLPLDVNQTDYRNDGHSYKWHCNAYEVAFYDKIRDLEQAKQSDKRSVEKDSAMQLHLFGSLRTKQKKLEILRMEVRLNKRQKIKQLFKKLDINTDLTFKKLFKPAISKKILLYYLDELESRRPILIDYKPAHDKALLINLAMHNQHLKPKQIFQLFGLKLALNIMNPRELRRLFVRYSQRSWYQLIADANKINLPAMASPFKVIREQLVKFKAVMNTQFAKSKSRTNPRQSVRQ